MTNPLRHQSRRDLLDRGLSVDEVRSARRRGALTRLARGLYVDAPAFDQLTADERYRVRIGALAARSPVWSSATSPRRRCSACRC